uniref:Uncharacterized protein n=1 Tax=Chromera velia CCMP2878 TaxID=1169474 RepID=A0A0G4HTG6_9ALVE|eukprot:Cvel_8478.t1-p1 / transcript=Cvel_8478.t1 / gene=Cvel_8478 / organism=Chromera_velia_CCMP2878 / gene_product=hypothetical protein / transcript_product=hypothetical protein / location=Cvel_scaffold468:52902-53642(-) / protein_length=181 / sequence_SO=supercontig / SO=protein_coding / is_pseudo=false
MPIEFVFAFVCRSAGSLKHTWEALQAAQQLKEWEHNGHKGHFRFELSEDISRKLVNVKPAQIGECMGEATGTEGSEEPEGHRATKKVCMEAGASQGDADALMETEVPAGESPVQRVRITGPCFFTSRASPGSSTRVTHVPTSSSRFGEASSLLATQRRQETLSTVNALGGRNGALKPPQLR